MLKQLIRQLITQLSFIALLSLGLTGNVYGLPQLNDEVELALAAVGTGSANEIKNRLFTHEITVFDEAARTQALTALPAEIRTQRITQGKLLRRAETVFQQVLALHGRSGKIELFLFQQDAPLAQLWRGC